MLTFSLCVSPVVQMGSAASKAATFAKLPAGMLLSTLSLKLEKQSTTLAPES